MNDFLKFVGAGLLLISALAFSREYDRFLSARIALARGFLELLLHIRQKINCFLSSAESLISDFENDALERAEYLSVARKEGICRAYFERESCLGVPSCIKKLLSEFFSGFGSDYKEGTLALIDRSSAALEAMLSDMISEKERSVKLVRTVSAAAALGAAILII